MHRGRSPRRREPGRREPRCEQRYHKRGYRNADDGFGCRGFSAIVQADGNHGRRTLLTPHLKSIGGHARHFDHALDARLEDAFAKCERFAQAYSEDVGVIGDGAYILARDPDFSAGICIDGLHFGTRSRSQQPFVWAAVLNGRVESESLPSDAIQRRRHKRRCHFSSVTKEDSRLHPEAKNSRWNGDRRGREPG
jgi:hypothetical protein